MSRAQITNDKLLVGPWVARKTFGHFTPDTSEAIGLERGGELVAGVLYENWNGVSMVVHVAVEGLMTPSYLHAIHHYPFIHAGASKVIAPVGEDNAESVRFVTKLGFQLEGRIPDAHPDGAILLYTLTRDRAKYLGERYGKECRSTAARA
jgi:RimJ/RimL family protein N-acetyltransferase